MRDRREGCESLCGAKHRLGLLQNSIGVRHTDARSSTGNLAMLRGVPTLTTSS